MISKGVAKMSHYTGPVRVMKVRDLSSFCACIRVQ